MFWAGGLPALLAFYIRMKVPESQAWQQHRLTSVRGILKTVGAQWQSFAYLVVFMTLMMFLSHGTQDLYPDFLKTAHGVSQSLASDVAMLYNLGAILGAVIFGQLSENFGRRRSIGLALVLALAVIPAWAFGASIVVLAIGAFLMQVGVQGAWGIIPAHLNELAPDTARGLIPGLAYQLGILFASPTNTIEHHLYERLGYQWALGGFEIANIILLAIVLALGSERRGRSFVIAASSLPPASQPAVS